MRWHNAYVGVAPACQVLHSLMQKTMINIHIRCVMHVHNLRLVVGGGHFYLPDPVETIDESRRLPGRSTPAVPRIDHAVSAA